MKTPPDPLVIFGAGGFAREVVGLIESLNFPEERWRLLGLVVEDSTLFNTEVCGYPIINGLRALVDQEFAGSGVVAVGNSKLAKRIVTDIKRSGLNLQFPVLKHPTVVGDWKRIHVAEGVLMCAGCILTTNIHLGAFTVLNMGCTLGHDVITGQHCICNPQAILSGNVTLDDNVLVGAGAMILQETSIGVGAQVSMGSVVAAEVAPWTVVAGNPARSIKTLEVWE